MEKPDKKIGKTFTVFAVVCLVVTGAIILNTISGKHESPRPAQAATEVLAASSKSFDADGGKIFTSYDETPRIYLAADSGDRNLAVFYSRRQYPGSPPRIPHSIEPSFSPKETGCLSCHAKGGFNADLGKETPVTPHPEKEACRQCHVPMNTDERFVEIDWKSIWPPKLGLSFLAGSPPPIPHSLQMRENCIPCHTGPGAVVEIRVEHPSRGNCRQCHVPAVQSEPLAEFERKPTAFTD